MRFPTSQYYLKIWMIPDPGPWKTLKEFELLNQLDQSPGRTWTVISKSSLPFNPTVDKSSADYKKHFFQAGERQGEEEERRKQGEERGRQEREPIGERNLRNSFAFAAAYFPDR